MIGLPLIDNKTSLTATEPRTSAAAGWGHTARGELAQTLIRPAVAADLLKIIDMTRLLAFETVGKILPLEEIRAGVQRVFDSPGRGQYYLACVGHQVIGQVAVLYVELNAWSNGLIYWIDDVYVRTEWRRQGIYRCLFTFVQELVLATPGARGIRLHCAPDNIAAQAAYWRLGMRPGGVMMEWFCPDNSGNLPTRDGTV
jgi:RimJ/RimL family protein N-acetyltransferase